MSGPNEKCRMCGLGWSRPSNVPRHPCPGCGTVEWDRENDLAQYLRARNEYFVVGERVGEGHLMSLDLVGTWNPRASAMAPLCHRLKEDYRHRKADLNARDGNELVVSFDTAPTRENRWELRVRRLTAVEARRRQTDACQRHRWAIRVFRESYDINSPADRTPCACPAEPPCVVCMYAARFAQERRRPGTDGTRFWTELCEAVQRDLGIMA